MGTTYDVRAWKTDVYKGKRTTTYWVQWAVAGERWKLPFKGKTQADSFRSELVTAARKGEAFDTDTGQPVSMARQGRAISWYVLACEFADMQWPRVAATTRSTHAEASMRLTLLMLKSTKGIPDAKLLRKALCRWAFNTPRRDADDRPEEIRRALDWVSRNTRDAATLMRPDVLRLVLDGMAVKFDGTRGAPSVVGRRRKIFNRLAEYAVETKALPANPLPELKWKAPKTVEVVDRRSVANPVQARTLLDAVRRCPNIGRRMVAFYACLYFAAMRPEEAAALAKGNLSLPTKGWGEFVLDSAEPYAGSEWTDTGKSRDKRQLKQRARGESRIVPCPPELTVIIWEHVDQFGFGADGRLFFGERNKDELPKGTINRVWREARAEAFTPEVYASPLVRRPYDLRHAAVSTWLNGGVPATQVAEWAGQSVEVLFRSYAKCLDGGEAALRQRMQAALGH